MNRKSYIIISIFLAQIIQPGVKGLSQQNIRNTNAVTLAQVRKKNV